MHTRYFTDAPQSAGPSESAILIGGHDLPHSDCDLLRNHERTSFQIVGKALYDSEMATGTGTAAVLPDGPDYLHLTLLLYGSAKGDPVGDERLGEHQRRAEIELRLKLPHAGMSAHEIQQFARGFVGLHYPNIKHTQKWYCEFCGERCRPSSSTCIVGRTSAHDAQTNLRGCRSRT